MCESPSYRQVIDSSFARDSDWSAYAHGEGEIPERPRAAELYGVAFFYLGDLRRAREASESFAAYSEDLYERHKDRYGRLYHLFQAALFSSLAQVTARGQSLWRRLIEAVHALPEDGMLSRRQAHLWIYEAYGHAKLGEYKKVSGPVTKGFEGISAGKGIDKAPHKNSREYGLADVLKALASHQLQPGAGSQEEAQKALVAYKRENLRYGRLGYPVIFDLQLSYPDVFTPVLPGPNPEED